MPNLLGLDEYLLDLICGFLETSGLLNVCLTCHAALLPARRHIFRHIVLQRHRNTLSHPLVVTINQFLDAHPEFEAACRTFELIGHKPNPLYEGDKDDAVFPVEWDPMLERDDILVQPFESKSDAQYISLISRFKRLRYLGLGIQFQSLALQLDASFRSLTHFNFLHDGYELGETWERTNVVSITPGLVQGIFQLPSIEQVDIHVPPTQLIPLQLCNLAQAPTLSSLTLGYPSLLDGEETAKLLTKTPDLEKFRFEFYEDRERTRGLPLREHLSIDQISQALLHCARSLTELEIVIYWDDGENPYGGAWSAEDQRINFGPEGTLSDLRKMTQLQRLEVPLAILVGLWPKKAPDLSETLPPNLHYLCLSDDMAHWLPYKWNPDVLDKHLRKWIPNLRKGAPLLDTFALQVSEKNQWPFSDYWTEENPDRFYGLCAKAGIEGIIHLEFEPRINELDEDVTSGEIPEDLSGSESEEMQHAYD
ncbi:MAG: hypothetical protein M1822_001782 [Bathelium mastoideum]|nr:MAG: hypothetical protein M1822_001782 [Bathelium mastoideum]